MNNGFKRNELLSRIFTSAAILPVLFALLTAFVSSVADAQEQQETQTSKIYYLKIDQDMKHHWDEYGFWYEANGSGTESVRPSEITNSIFVVGDVFHLRPHRPNKDQEGNVNHNVAFGYYYDTGSHTNKLYIGYKVDLTTGTVDLNNYDEGVYGVLHLKTQARNGKEAKITVDDLYIGRGEIFQGESFSVIGLYGSLTIQGDARIRNVAEDSADTEDRVLRIYSSIHGSGILQFESEKTHGHHTSEIYIMSSENDFSGDVYIESGTNIHIDDPDEMHYSYDYQTHLFLTGENALYNASTILNEGIVNITANQIFKNYDGDDSYGQFSGVGQLIVNDGVTVELVYDNERYSNEPIGLITIKNEHDNPGTLIFNIPEGMTKTINMSTNSADYSKIDGQGTIVKTGDGTLQILNAAKDLVGAECLVISSGRLDIQGYFEGTIKVGDDKLADEVAFTPGVPGTPDSFEIDGELILTDHATLLMEIGGTSEFLNDQLVLAEDSSLSYTENTVVRFNPLSSYSPSANDKISVIMPEFDWTKAKFSSDVFILLYYENGIQYLGVNPNYVPEPSTWVLLILGAAGMLYLRKRR